MKRSHTGLNDNPQSLIQKLLLHLGEDTQREGLRETPDRVLKMYHELLGGYTQEEKKLYKTFASNGYNEIITVANIDFYSLCEHHLIPFFGRPQWQNPRSIKVRPSCRNVCPQASDPGKPNKADCRFS